MQVASDQRNTSRAGAWPMYRALMGVGIVCGLLIVSVYVLTLPFIARNEAAALAVAVFKVLPGATSKTSFVLTADNSFRLAQDEGSASQMVYAGYDGEGALIGVAIPAQGMGYQDTIRLLYGYAPVKQAIVGMQVLASRETPGLGDKIARDRAFLNNFTALDVSLAEDGLALQHAIEAVKSGTKTSAWQIDGITGATISSKAVAGILRHSSERWIPLVNRQLAVLSSGADHDGE